ncbi:MAG: nuclear transport factor 2 family protein [Gemmatimonadaceae bacterium]
MVESQECKPPRPAEATAAIRVLNQQYIDAARTNDVTWFRDHMAEDVVIVLGSGRRVRKPAFLAMLTDEPKTFRSLTVRDVTLRVFGSTVQVDADAPWELGDGSTGVSRYIDTYAWLDCRWQVISAQITLLRRSTSVTMRLPQRCR